MNLIFIDARATLGRTFKASILEQRQLLLNNAKAGPAAAALAAVAGGAQLCDAVACRALRRRCRRRQWGPPHLVVIQCTGPLRVAFYSSQIQTQTHKATQSVGTLVSTVLEWPTGPGAYVEGRERNLSIVSDASIKTKWRRRRGPIKDVALVVLVFGFGLGRLHFKTGLN